MDSGKRLRRCLSIVKGLEKLIGTEALHSLPQSIAKEMMMERQFTQQLQASAAEIQQLLIISLSDIGPKEIAAVQRFLRIDDSLSTDPKHLSRRLTFLSALRNLQVISHWPETVEDAINAKINAIESAVSSLISRAKALAEEKISAEQFNVHMDMKNLITGKSSDTSPSGKILTESEGMGEPLSLLVLHSPETRKRVIEFGNWLANHENVNSYVGFNYALAFERAAMEMEEVFDHRAKRMGEIKNGNAVSGLMMGIFDLDPSLALYKADLKTIKEILQKLMQKFEQ